MTEPIVIVGLGAEGIAGLGPVARSAVQAATFLAGGRRHLRLVGPTDAETYPITDNLEGLLTRLARRGPGERCVVLASGDPLFYGVGHRITEAIGRDQVRVETSVSSMQVAFARVGLSWHDAAVASVHGRPLKTVLLPLLGIRKIGLFARDGESPSEVARFFLDRGLDDYDAWVCENLNSAQESVTSAALPDLVGRRFADLNVMVLHRRPSHLAGAGPAEAPPPDPAEGSFARPPEGAALLTHEDIRELVLRRFRGLCEGSIWDIGAGLGGLSVTLARAFPDRELVAVERSATRAEYLRINRSRFEAYNIRVVEGEAPDCLQGEDRPSGIFLGGSGGQLGPILSLVAEHLLPGGRIVANFVGIENLAYALERLRDIGWQTELTQVQLSEGQMLSGLTTLVPRRPVWIIRAERR
jgi:precorrin-6Y C5,15-methyltransferase (decarboxylating)